MFLNGNVVKFRELERSPGLCFEDDPLKLIFGPGQSKPWSTPGMIEDLPNRVLTVFPE